MRVDSKKVTVRIAAVMIERRNALGLSLQQVADRSGLSKSHIWEIEAGNSINPTIGSLVRISRALGISLDYLAGLSTSLPDLHPDAMRIAIEIDTLLRKEAGNGR